MAWTHRLSSKDTEALTGVCSACGPVELKRKPRPSRNAVYYYCINAWKDSREKYDKGDYKRNRNRKYRRGTHGLTWEEARDFCENKTCMICDSSEDLVVDHCHLSGRIRGVLCRKCNAGIGLLGDSISTVRRALEYLEAGD